MDVNLPLIRPLVHSLSSVYVFHNPLMGRSPLTVKTVKTVVPNNTDLKVKGSVKGELIPL